MRSEPQDARALVWAPPVSLAATPGIDVSFSSSGYLDVSVHRVPLRTLWIHARIRKVFLRGFPHSEISGSQDIRSSPKLFAAYHVFHRLLVPRHPPCALSGLTSAYIALHAGPGLFLLRDSSRSLPAVKEQPAVGGSFFCPLARAFFLGCLVMVLHEGHGQPSDIFSLYAVFKVRVSDKKDLIP